MHDGFSNIAETVFEPSSYAVVQDVGIPLDSMLMVVSHESVGTCWKIRNPAIVIYKSLDDRRKLRTVIAV